MNNQIQTVLVNTKHVWCILMAIVLLGLAIRLYGVNMPLVESHQVRQAQTAMMARNLFDDNMDIFHTRLDYFGNVPGYIIMEFPLMHGIAALLYYLFGVHETIGRLVNVSFSIGAMFLMFGLARQFLPVVGAFAALALYAFSPMNIFFSRAFMPEASMMFFIVGAIYFFLKWLDRQTLLLYSTAIIFAAFACLTKPTAAILFVPILTAWFLKYRWTLFRRSEFWLYMLLATVPLIFWGAYANYFNAMQSYIPSGFGGNWLELIKSRGITNHWFDPAFYVFVGGSIILILLTPLGFAGTAIGVFICTGDRCRILYLWLGAIIVYFFVFSGANAGHIYYHLPLLPLAAIFFGFAVEWLLHKKDFLKEIFKRKSIVWLGSGLLLAIFISYGIGYYKYFQYMYSNRMPYVLEVSEIIKKLAPPNLVVVLNQPGAEPTVFSYYSQSKVFFFRPLLEYDSIADIEYLRTQGATTYVALDTKYGSGVHETQKNKLFWQYLNKKYKLVMLTSHYMVVDLKDGGRK